jgi:hypothetical protein
MSDYNLRCDCGEYVIVRALEEEGFQTSEHCTSCGRNWRLVFARFNNALSPEHGALRSVAPLSAEISLRWPRCSCLRLRGDVRGRPRHRRLPRCTHRPGGCASGSKGAVAKLGILASTLSDGARKDAGGGAKGHPACRWLKKSEIPAS